MTESHECTDAQARQAAEVALAYYQQSPSHEAQLAHQPAQPGTEFGAYGVRTKQSGTAWVYAAFYRARRFIPWPDNPCGAYSLRMNCTEAEAYAIAKEMELYYTQRESPYGAYVLPAYASGLYCLMWTTPAGCYYTVYYDTGKLDSGKCSDCE